jgi:hypothetical protein
MTDITDKHTHIQNEREQEGANSPATLHACGANYPSQERAISPAAAARATLHQGGSILPAAGTTRTRNQRGALLCLCGESELDLT